MITIKDLIHALETFSINHKQINTFEYGFDDKITTHDILYPLMYVKIDRNQSISSQSKNRVSVFLLDLSKQDDSNSLDIISNMELIGNDIISYFLDDDGDFYVDETNVNSNPLFNYTDDNCDGYKYELDFINRKNLNSCILPLEPIYIPMSIEVIQLTNINIYGGTCDVFVSASGGTEPYIGTGIFNVSAGDNTFIVTDLYGYRIEKTINISQPDELIATATADTPNERIREPFLTQIQIDAEGGIAPYSVDTKLGYAWNQDSIVNIYNYTTSDGTYEVVDENSFIVDITNVVGNYPIYWFFYDNTMINGNDYLITFDYEFLSGYSNSFLFRIDGTFTPGGYFAIKTAAQSGSVSQKFTNGIDGTPKFGIQFQFGNGEPVRIKISNLKIFYLDESFNNQLPTSDVQTWGDYSYDVTDSVGATATTNSTNLSVPTPDGSLRLTITDGGTYNGYDAFFRMYVNTAHPMNDGYVYVNWGDGTIESYDYNTGYQYFNHTYADEFKNKTLPIDIYGNVQYYRFIEGCQPVIEPEWFAKEGGFYKRYQDDFQSRLYMYHGYINGPINELYDNFGRSVDWLYFYYNSIPWGDIGLASEIESYYGIVYYPHTNNLLDSNRVNTYGDIGTFMKGNYREDVGAYYKYLVTYCGSHTYLDRIDKPVLSYGSGNYVVYSRGYIDSASYWSISDPNQVAQLIVDLDTWWVNPSGGIITLTNNASPNDADEPLLSEFLAAKANLIANGANVQHS